MVKLADYIDISELETPEVSEEGTTSFKEEASEMENSEEKAEAMKSETEDNLSSAEEGEKENEEEAKKDDENETGAKGEQATINVDDVRNLDKNDEALIDVNEIVAAGNVEPQAQAEAQWKGKRKNFYKRFYIHVEEIMESAKAGKVENLDDLYSSMNSFLAEEELIDIMYSTAMTTKEYPDNIATHSVNCCIYSIMLAKGMKMEPQKIEELAVAMLVHDVGMSFVPEDILNKKGKLSRRDFDEIRKHPNYGYNYLKKAYPDKPYLSLTAYHDHERHDGSGYPQGLSGNDIFEYAKIAGIVDTFEALTHDRPNREKMLPFQAIQSILQRDKPKYQKNILKAVISRLSLFPKYSYVRLNTNAIGQVINVDERYPLRPCLKILCDAAGEKILDEYTVDLKKSSLLYITGSAELPTLH